MQNCSKITTNKCNNYIKYKDTFQINMMMAQWFPE